MNIKKTLFLGGILLALALAAVSAGAAEPPKAKLPVLTTSAGQSQDTTTINIVCDEAGIGYDYCDVPTVEMLAAGVGLAGKQSAEGFHVEVHSDLAKFPKGTPFKTVIFAIGASLKGMGASGLTVDTEEARLKKLVAYCKEKKIAIIGIHVGGKSTRGAAGSDNERMIDAIAPEAGFLLVTKESNFDGRFSKIAKAKNIPLVEVEYALDLVDIFKKIFQ
jgi:Domain of unknown function (DUF6305)